LFKPRAARIFRFLTVAATAAFALFCVLLLAVRFFFFPRIDDYRARIEATLTAQLGQPVAIAAIDTGWDGWNPRLTIRGVQIHDRDRPAAGPLVDLPRIDLVVSWTSLPLLDLRLKELAIDRPQLSVRRDKAGRLHVAGIEIDPDRQSDDQPATEWLLRQPSIVVTDALLTWTDELRGAPQLVLDNVQFRLEHSFGHHRFGLVGTPPAELASPLDFRGDVTDASLKDWRDAHGRFYVRLDYADIALWHEWIPLPIPVDNGKGALRAWFDFAGGAPTGMVADFELADVRTRLGKNLPQLDLANVAGHLDWKRQAGKRVLLASGLTFTTPAALTLAPTDFDLTLTEASDGSINGGSLTIDRLDAEPLTALAAHLQLPESLRRILVQYSPRGIISNGKFSWSGPSSANSDIPEKFSASGNLQRVGLAPVQGVPGITGLSGTFDLDQAHGSANFDSRDLRLDAPRLWNESLVFSSVGGGMTWNKRDGDWRVAIDNLRLAGAPVSGVVNGTWTSKGDGPGRLDLRASLGNAAVPEIARFMPLVLSAGLRDWLRDSLKQGTASDVRVNVTGDLADFPFADNRNGKFLISLKVSDGTLSFMPDWPPIEGLDAELKFEGARMSIDAVRARSLGAQLGPTKADIPNLGAANPILTVVGTASGPTSEFLRYIAQSPVDGWIDHVTEGVTATGSGKLELKLTLPLGKERDAKVAGDYEFVANELRFPNVPMLGRVNGRLAFTEQEVRAQEVAFEALGGPAKVGISSVDGHVRVAGSGTANLAAMRNELDLPMLDHVSGSTDWQVTMDSAASAVSWSVSSSMKGAMVDLPAPIGKSAADAAPLKIERREVTGRANEDLVTADYGNVLRVVAHRSLVAKEMAADRVLVSLGAGSAGMEAPSRPGIAVRGQLSQLDIDQWLALYAREKRRGTGGATNRGHTLDMNSLDLDLGKLDIFGRVLHDFKVNAQREGEDWQLTMAGREVDGHATWRGASAELPNGRLTARLTRFVPPGPGELHVVRGEPDALGNTANPWPELDIVSDTFVSKGRDLGKLDLVAQPAGSDWHIQQLSLSNPDGRLDANGWWRVHGDGQQTLIDATVDVTDAGGYLARFGYGDLVRNAPTKISGKLQWTGAPNDFDYPSLTGSFNLHSGSGQFLKIDPGIGKLLGVLSLQALPRRITLDFHDVFSEGFAFDDIAGDVRIDNGVMHTGDLKLAGPAAAVAINGDVDLEKETQRLEVRVQPSLSSGVSAGAAVLFIANPLVGVAVGAGALIAQKLFNNPIDQMFSFEYRVTGPWADPLVERVNGRELTTKAPPGAGFGSEPITK
jgi:uncharacterized protein (TIGR02099 family)